MAGVSRYDEHNKMTELDFIINCDIKLRVCDELNAGE